jgi:hypothetical protein
MTQAIVDIMPPRQSANLGEGHRLCLASLMILTIAQARDIFRPGSGKYLNATAYTNQPNAAGIPSDNGWLGRALDAGSGQHWRRC